MSYLNQAQDPRRRATAIVTAGAFNALLAAGLVTGLATDFTKIVATELSATNIPLEPPPPPPDPTPPPPNPIDRLPTPPIPPIPFPLPPNPPPVPTDTTDATWAGDSGPTVPLPPPTPPQPSFTPKRALPSNNVSRWITNDDYPRPALVDQAEGSVSYRLVIGTNGRVSSCELTRPSGIPSLDAATCRLITSRARFAPATDEAGARVLGTYTGSVTWQIPD